MGLKNPSTASTRFGQIKRKLAEKFGGSLPSTPAGAKTADASDKSASAKKSQKGSAGKKRKVEDDGTPTKKGRPAKKVKSVKEEEVEEVGKADEVDEDTTAIKKELAEAADGYDDEYVVLFCPHDTRHRLIHHHSTINVKTSDDP